MFPQSWNSLEVAKLSVGVLTPVSVAILAWFLNRRLKKFDLIQWHNQKLIEKRLAIYDLVAPNLNLLLCFFTWVGYWKDVSPQDAIQAKRDLDKTFNIYRHLFEADVYEAYQNYIHVLFETYTGPGHDAHLRTTVQGPDGDRKCDRTYEWQDKWLKNFTSSDVVPSMAEVRKAYANLMSALTYSFGIQAHDV